MNLFWKPWAQRIYFRRTESDKDADGVEVTSHYNMHHQGASHDYF